MKVTPQQIYKLKNSANQNKYEMMYTASDWDIKVSTVVFKQCGVYGYYYTYDKTKFEDEFEEVQD